MRDEYFIVAVIIIIIFFLYFLPQKDTFKSQKDTYGKLVPVLDSKNIMALAYGNIRQTY